jgi:rhodanese-related sulfurtransferase
VAPTTALTADQARTRLHELTVIDVRTPGEYASGHLPGAHDIPLDHLDTALPALKTAADRGDLLIVCASGARSAQACRRPQALGPGAPSPPRRRLPRAERPDRRTTLEHRSLALRGRRRRHGLLRTHRHLRHGQDPRETPP